MKKIQNMSAFALLFFTSALVIQAASKSPYSRAAGQNEIYESFKDEDGTVRRQKVKADR